MGSVETRSPYADNAGAVRATRVGPGGASGTGGVATRATRPADVTRKPSAASCSKAAVTVVRETPRSAASARVDGADAPAGSVPSAIWARSRS